MPGLTVSLTAFIQAIATIIISLSWMLTKGPQITHQFKEMKYWE